MSVSLFIVGLLAAPQAATAPSQVVEVSDRWKWRHCTRLSTDAQLRARVRSLQHADIVEKAFKDCAEHLPKQSPDEIDTLKSEQTQLIKLDVEMFYWDIVAHRI